MRTKKINVIEVGNIMNGIVPTTEELKKWENLIKEAIKDENGNLIVPQGILKIYQEELLVDDEGKCGIVVLGIDKDKKTGD